MALNSKKRNTLQYLAAFLLPVLLTVVVFAALGFYPFGDSSTLTGDLNGIELPIYAELQHAVQTGESLSYSFFKHLGGSMFSTSRLFPSLELVFLAVDIAYYPLVAMILLVVYIGLAGLSCFCALRYFNQKASWVYVLLSTGYAMMTYVFAYN